IIAYCIGGACVYVHVLKQVLHVCVCCLYVCVCVCVCVSVCVSACVLTYMCVSSVMSTPILSDCCFHRGAAVLETGSSEPHAQLQALVVGLAYRRPPWSGSPPRRSVIFTGEH